MKERILGARNVINIEISESHVQDFVFLRFVDLIVARPDSS